MDNDKIAFAYGERPLPLNRISLVKTKALMDTLATEELPAVIEMNTATLALMWDGLAKDEGCPLSSLFIQLVKNEELNTGEYKVYSDRQWKYEQIRRSLLI